MTYSIYTQFFSSALANASVNIVEAGTGIPATILASPSGGLLNTQGQATLDSTGLLTVVIDTAKTWTITPYDDDPLPKVVPSLSYNEAVSLKASLPQDGSVFAISEVTPYVNLTATGAAFTGPCELAGYDCMVAAGNITIYDNTSAAGTIIVPTTALTVGRVEFNWKRALNTGCYVVLSGAATVNVLVG